jgi:hypothetical protein
MTNIVTFNGIVIDFKKNPKNSDQFITKVQVGINSEGEAISRDCFTKTSLVSKTIPVTDEETGESTEQSVPNVHRGDTVSVTISKHTEGEQYERNVKKGDKYIDVSGTEVVAEKAGMVTHTARTNGFNVMSITPISFELLERATNLWGR